jgi:hypothetical protein
MYEDPKRDELDNYEGGDFDKFNLWRELGFKILNDCEHIPLVVKSVRPGSWAKRWGLSRGDVILSIGDDTLSRTDRLTAEEIMHVLWMIRPLELHVLHGKYRVIEAEIRAKARPKLE